VKNIQSSILRCCRDLRCTIVSQRISIIVKNYSLCRDQSLSLNRFIAITMIISLLPRYGLDAISSNSQAIQLSDSANAIDAIEATDSGILWRWDRRRRSMTVMSNEMRTERTRIRMKNGTMYKIDISLPCLFARRKRINLDLIICITLLFLLKRLYLLISR